MRPGVAAFTNRREDQTIPTAIIEESAVTQ